METLLSGKSELPFGTFVLFMQPIHLIIGLVEGFVTVGIITYVQKARPEILQSSIDANPLNDSISVKNVLVVFLILAGITGGALSWFASTHPDGLEWSIEKVTGKGELAGQEQGIAVVLKGIQDKTVFFPDYNFKPGVKEESKEEKAPVWPGIEPGTSVAGIVGGGIVLGFLFIIGFGIRFFKRK